MKLTAAFSGSLKNIEELAPVDAGRVPHPRLNKGGKKTEICRSRVITKVPLESKWHEELYSERRPLFWVITA